jgi:acetolactate synthase-1/3 small subunit
MVSRELGLLKVAAGSKTRSEVIQLVEIFGAQIVDVTSDVVTIQVTGTSEELENFERLLEPFGIVELVKTGVIALSRGSHVT